MEMNAMQAVASSALPTSLPPALPLRSSSSKQFSGIRSLKREFPRLKCASRSGRVEVRAHDCEDDDEIASSSSVLYSVAPLILLADSTGYSQASYNTTLGLFLLSLPGVWSLVKRATKSKVCDDVYVRFNFSVRSSGCSFPVSNCCREFGPALKALGYGVQ